MCCQFIDVTVSQYGMLIQLSCLHPANVLRWMCRVCIVAKHEYDMCFQHSQKKLFTIGPTTGGLSCKIAWSPCGRVLAVAVGNGNVLVQDRHGALVDEIALQKAAKGSVVPGPELQVRYMLPCLEHMGHLAVLIGMKPATFDPAANKQML